MSVHYGDELGVLGRAFNDMSDAIRDREQEIRAERDRAEAASVAKSTFLANMSHELRTPLHGILSFAGFGVKKHEQADRARLGGYFEKIAQSGGALLELLNDLLDLAKLESGKVEFDMRPTLLSGVVTQVVGEFESLFTERGIQATVTANGGDPPVRADPAKLQQVLRNVLSNAVRFSPPGGTDRGASHGGRRRDRDVHPERGAEHPRGRAGQHLRQVRPVEQDPHRRRRDGARALDLP